MESAAILHIVCSSVKDRSFVTGAIISDNDNVMRAHLRHKTDKAKDKGKLPVWVYEPDFLADPGHRKKSVSKHFYTLASQPVKKSRVNNAIAKRMKKNWGYMIKQNKHKPIEEFVASSQAPLEHIFDNHQFCEPKWCLKLKAQQEGKPYNHPEQFLDKSTEDGAKMYEDLSKITLKYGAAAYLIQSKHNFSTQINKSLNQAQACLTPKNKSFHESKSFHHRHAIVIGTHNWGHCRYWTSVFDALSIPFSQTFVNHLENVDQKKKKWKEYHSKTEVKRKRGYHQEAIERKLLYENRTTEYASGIGLIGQQQQEPQRKRAKRTYWRCGSTTHLTT